MSQTSDIVMYDRLTIGRLYMNVKIVVKLALTASAAAALLVLSCVDLLLVQR